MTKRHVTILLLTVLICACGPSVPQLLLEIDGYGYVIGDVVEIKTSEPNVNDLVVYDPFKNESICGGFAPAMALGKVVGVPGQALTVEMQGLKIDSQIIELDRDYSQENAVFGAEKYENLATRTITFSNMMMSQSRK